MTLLFRKIQNQIVALRQRGYPFDYIRVRATPAALDRMLREAAVKDPTAYESMTRYQDGRIFHCEQCKDSAKDLLQERHEPMTRKGCLSRLLH